MECKFCGRELEDDAVYCFYCGKRLDGKKPCPSCKALLPEDGIFCGKCGKRVEPEVLEELEEAEEKAEKAEAPEEVAEPEENPAENPESSEQSEEGEESEKTEESEEATPPEETSEQKSEGQTKELVLHSAKWKKAIEITKICLAGLAALVGFVFTFCIGIAVTSDSQTEVFMLDYFGKVYENLDRIIVSNNLGDTQSFALYMPYIFGTLIALAALICNFVFTIMTVISAVRQYAYKNAKADFVKPALKTFISYAIFAALFYALKAVPSSTLESVKSTVYFNNVTLAALIIGGVAFGGYYACRVVSRLTDFTDKNEIINSSVALGTGVVGVAAAILLTLTVCRFSTAYESYSLSLMQMVLHSSLIIQDGTNCGGVMCFGICAFAVQTVMLILTVCMIVSTSVRVGSGSGKKPLGAAIATAVLSVLYFLGSFAAANMFNSEVSESSVSRSYGVPITVIALSVLMLGGIIASIVLDKQRAKRASKSVA
ncbi:MAG: zinc ribbon domain-containing protein [Clostridia bacterium]|nr:zinc ribbon domain-containing protein [Clostridia bacterium]